MYYVKATYQRGIILLHTYINYTGLTLMFIHFNRQCLLHYIINQDIVKHYKQCTKMYFCFLFLSIYTCQYQNIQYKCHHRFVCSLS